METFLDHHLFKFPPGLLRPFLDARDADFKDRRSMYVLLLLYYYYYYYYYAVVFSFSPSFISVMDIFGVEEVCWRKAAFTNVQ